MRHRLGFVVVGTLAAVLVAAPAEAASSTSCALVAHRGDHGSATENGMPAMRAAVAAGAEYLEVDVRTTRDDKLVLMHDEKVDRTTDGTGYIARKTARQVRGLRLEDGTRVPYLGQVLRLAARVDVRVLVEVKALPTAASYRRLAATIREHGTGRITVMSFSRPRLDRVRQYAPKVAKALISSQALTPEQVSPYRRVAVHHASVTDEWLASMADAGISVFAWTVDTVEDWERLSGRVLGMITDEPDGYAEYRESAPACAG